MSTLDEALKLACQKGMTHLTIYPIPSADNKTIYWCARATPSTGHSYVQVATLDPVEAVMEVLKALPSAKRRAAISKDRGSTYEARHTPVTAPVTETPPEPETMNTWLPKT